MSVTPPFNIPVELGTFELKGQKLMITDPCYVRGTGGQCTVDHALAGTWTASATYSDEGDWGPRVRSVEARNCAELPATSEIAVFEVGVDSGQAGIFDESRYPVGDCGDWDGGGSFYDRCCDATLATFEVDGTTPRPFQGDVVAEGVVTRSGYGDGIYSCCVWRDDQGNCVAIKIVFIDEPSDESETDDDEKLPYS